MDPDQPQLQQPPPESQDRTQPGAPRCPNCGWQNVRLSHSRGLLDKLLGALSIGVFRCRTCGNRFRRFRRRPESDE